MQRIANKFASGEKVLTAFVTAGFPEHDSLPGLVREMEEAGVGMVEVGIPFSDPMADGPAIQMSSRVALENGMTLPGILSQVKEIRKQSEIPLLLMGYLNPVMQYGMEQFVKDASSAGVDGLILPDLPPELYASEYKELFECNNMATVFLVTPDTSESRAKYIEQLTTGFIYVVSSSSTTGGTQGFSAKQKIYFEKQSKRFEKPIQIGFGISRSQDVQDAFQYANGAIIGSKIIREISDKQKVKDFISGLLTG